MTKLLLNLIVASALTGGSASAALAQAAPASTASQAAQALRRVSPVRGAAQAGLVTVETVDLSPRFLDFYAAAQGKTPDARFAEWRARYGFAAVPPTPAGQAVARKLVDAAWDRYPAALPRIRGGMGRLTAAAAPMIARVAEVLRLERPAKLKLVGYVGGFEDNAFTAPEPGGVVALSLPLESSPEFVALVVPHEATHAVHAVIAGLSPEYERTLARVILEEGLAMHVAKVVAPGKPDAAYTERLPGWHRATRARLPDILRGLRPALRSSSPDDLMRFTMGEGAAGFEREAYAAGWAVVGRLLADGMTPADIARVPEADMPALVERTTGRLLTSTE